MKIAFMLLVVSMFLSGCYEYGPRRNYRFNDRWDRYEHAGHRR